MSVRDEKVRRKIAEIKKKLGAGKTNVRLKKLERRLK